MSHGTDQIDMFGRSAFYIDRILRGAKPAELPVQGADQVWDRTQPQNCKSAGLDVPPSLLVRAHEVME